MPHLRLRPSIRALPRLRSLAVLAALACSSWAYAQNATAVPQDEFEWLGAINKATAVINTQQGLLDQQVAPRVAQGLVQVLEAGKAPGWRKAAQDGDCV